MQRFGSPYEGGWKNWPAAWLLPVETALHVYETLTAVNDARGRLEGDALEKWTARNARVVQAAMNIQAIRDEVEATGDGG